MGGEWGRAWVGGQWGRAWVARGHAELMVGQRAPAARRQLALCWLRKLPRCWRSPGLHASVALPVDVLELGGIISAWEGAEGHGMPGG